MSANTKAIKFKRMADALFESGGGSSSGSEHFPSGSLSDMVNSFLQRSVVEDVSRDEGDHKEKDEFEFECASSSNNVRERKRLLKKLLGLEDEDQSVVEARRKIVQEIEAVVQIDIDFGCVDSGFKRRVMDHLRQLGYDAGLCKSRWEKTGRYPAGTYEYVDIITSSASDPFSREIIEIMPASLFKIARPTPSYTALLDEFPHIFVGKPDKLKQVARVMSTAMKESLKSNDLPVAPWRRNGYLQAQWFAPYKRTINVISSRPGHESVGHEVPQGKVRKVIVGFVEELNLSGLNGGVVYDCGREVSTKGEKRSGLLAAVFQGKLLEAMSSQ